MNQMEGNYRVKITDKYDHRVIVDQYESKNMRVYIKEAELLFALEFVGQRKMFYNVGIIVEELTDDEPQIVFESVEIDLARDREEHRARIESVKSIIRRDVK